MIYFLIFLAALVAAALIYLATLQGEYEVCRSLPMDVDRQRVFDKIRDFRTWKDWSPWLMHEPDTLLEFSDGAEREGGFHTWDGKRVGAGKLTHTRFDEPRRIEQRIEFTRPFKAVSGVWWDLSERDGQTVVSWCMRGRMPFLLRFMTATTRQMIEKDYELGLAMLRGTLDKDAERPVLRFRGETIREVTTALTIPFAGGMEEMVKAMEAGFPRLGAQVERSGVTSAGSPFTAYHAVDPKKMYFRCDMAVPVPDGADAGEFELKPLGGGRYFKVEVRGSYDFLESAWYSAMSHIRMLKLKQDRSRPSLEVYENDPCSVEHSNEIRTSLHIPIK